MRYLWMVLFRFIMHYVVDQVVRRVGALLFGDALVEPADMAAAARSVAAELGRRFPGRSIEVRVPPYAAVQVGVVGGDGPSHRRGTPPNVVEVSPETFVRLAVGVLSWGDAVGGGLVKYSGVHAGDVAMMLPLE